MGIIQTKAQIELLEAMLRHKKRYSDRDIKKLIRYFQKTLDTQKLEGLKLIHRVKDGKDIKDMLDLINEEEKIHQQTLSL